MIFFNTSDLTMVDLIVIFIINFRWINRRCYYFSESKADFQRAKSICKDIFPTSLSPGVVFEGRSMSDERKVFRATLSIDIHNTVVGRDFWIGMNDESVEGTVYILGH